MPKETTYTAQKDFTDMLGRFWKKGQTFVGQKQESATLAALEAKQIEEDPPTSVRDEKLETMHERGGKVEPTPEAKVDVKPPHDATTYGTTKP